MKKFATLALGVVAALSFGAMAMAHDLTMDFEPTPPDLALFDLGLALDGDVGLDLVSVDVTAPLVPDIIAAMTIGDVDAGLVDPFAPPAAHAGELVTAMIGLPADAVPPDIRV